MVMAMIAGGLLVLVGMAVEGVLSRRWRHVRGLLYPRRPNAYIQFDADQSDAERLAMLEAARAGVLDGRLSQAQHLKNHGAGDQGQQPAERMNDES